MCVAQIVRSNPKKKVLTPKILVSNLFWYPSIFFNLKISGTKIFRDWTIFPTNRFCPNLSGTQSTYCTKTEVKTYGDLQIVGTCGGPSSFWGPKNTFRTKINFESKFSFRKKSLRTKCCSLKQNQVNIFRTQNLLGPVLILNSRFLLDLKKNKLGLSWAKLSISLGWVIDKLE